MSCADVVVSVGRQELRPEALVYAAQRPDRGSERTGESCEVRDVRRMAQHAGPQSRRAQTADVVESLQQPPGQAGRAIVGDGANREKRQSALAREAAECRTLHVRRARTVLAPEFEF